MKLKKYSLSSIIEDVLSQPTAPFRESWVIAMIYSLAEKLKIPVYEDFYGNLWLGISKKSQLSKTRLLFVAHTDHPGMIVEKFEQTKTKTIVHAKWLGGGPQDLKNHPVRVFSHLHSGFQIHGKIIHSTNAVRSADKVKIEISPHAITRFFTKKDFKKSGPWGACLCYKGHGISHGVKQTNDKWVTKAADDLIGVCALIYALSNAKLPKGVAVLLSRAEECGFHGTLAVLNKKLLDPLKTYVISIETSAQLPGALLSHGPVVRLGDRATVFDPSLVFWMQQKAEQLMQSSKQFKFQRRVMDGGTCEATAFNAFGFSVAGISTPLENYHNLAPTAHGPSGGGAGKPMPEAVSKTDVERLELFLSYLMKQASSLPPPLKRSAVFKSFRNLIVSKHLKEGKR